MASNPSTMRLSVFFLLIPAAFGLSSRAGEIEAQRVPLVASTASLFFARWILRALALSEVWCVCPGVFAPTFPRPPGLSPTLAPMAESGPLNRVFGFPVVGTPPLPAFRTGHI